MDLEEQAPLLRGCPDRGGERQAKGGAQTLRSNDWREARAAHFASRASVFEEHVGKQGGGARRASTHGVDLPTSLEEQAPLLRGCPDRGGERQAKGGAQTLRSNDWGEARAAHFASRAR